MLFRSNGLWPMFLFGFAAVFILTQMHGLGLSRLARAVFVLAYVAGIVIVYATVRPLANVHEVVRIPIVEYALVYLLALAIWLGLLAADRLFAKPAVAAT